MKNIFLFGAGASKGCNGTNFSVPTGEGLFPLLKKEFPNTWGNLGSDLDDDFSVYFEKGMEKLWKNHSTSVHFFMKDLAVLLSAAQIVKNEENLYLRIINKLKDEGSLKQSILSTLNYDCLIEIAVSIAGLKTNYFDTPNNNSAAVWKIHGSCNFKVKGVEVNSVAKYSNAVTFNGSGIEILQPNEVRSYCYSDTSLYPAMSIYMKDKPLQIAAANIKNLQAKWQKEVKVAEKIIIIGTYPNLEDKHIWDHISASTGQIYFCGNQEQFKEWQKIVNRNDNYLGSHFEKCIDKILELI